MSWLEQIKRPVPILIVDDDPADLLLFESATEDFHRDLVKCESGEEALAVLKERRDFQIIILDEKLPKMRGMDLFKEIVRMYDGCDCRPTVIFVTGYAGVLVEEVSKVGFASVMGKPLGSRRYLREMMASLHVPRRNGKAAESESVRASERQSVGGVKA